MNQCALGCNQITDKIPVVKLKQKPFNIAFEKINISLRQVSMQIAGHYNRNMRSECQSRERER